MILGAEIAILLGGLYFMVVGRMPARRGRSGEVRGWRARLVGLVMVSPVPLALAATIAGFVARALLTGEEPTEEEIATYGMWVELAAVVAAVVVASVLESVFARAEEGREGGGGSRTASSDGS
jgi:hypothetical protein